MIYGLVDCDNCFVSCERVFRPDLEGKPVVVLSNNDGCVIARSNETKALGVKMGMPYYQMRENYPDAGITAFSSNYELYGNMSNRVMNILRSETPVVMQYSIDEAFMDLTGMENLDLKEWGEKLSKKIRKWVGMPVSIGIAPTKTLAKVASHFAKKYPGYNKCCVIDDDWKREQALRLTPIGDVWGVGRRNVVKMEAGGVHSAYDLTKMSKGWVQRNFNITGVRTWRELRGEDCIETEQLDNARKSICTSRSFAEMLEEMEEISTQVSNFAARCAEKLRKQHTVAGLVTVFIDTNHHREDLQQYDNSGSRTLLTPTNITQTIISASISILRDIYRSGYKYKRAGVILTDIRDAGAVQTDFDDYDAEKHKKMQKLTDTIDEINRNNGRDSIVLGSQQYKVKGTDGKNVKFVNAIKRSLKSPDYTKPDNFIINH